MFSKKLCGMKRLRGEVPQLYLYLLHAVWTKSILKSFHKVQSTKILYLWGEMSRHLGMTKLLWVKI
jgi:hypothetical protein